MFQETDTKTTDAAASGEREGVVRGVWWLALGTLVSAVACWIWLIPAVSSAGYSVATTTSDPVLAQVSDSELSAALASMGGTPDFLARFKPDSKRCAEPLAWVMLSRPSGEVTGRVRIQSGTYVSPLFEPSDVAVRVAIPFPSPYETGHGTLSVLGSGRTILALMPAWRPYVSGKASVPVSWSVGKKCARANG